MDRTQDEYHFNFFSPRTPLARKNRNMIVWLVIIWAVAIFGFQIALRVLENPVPEQSLVEFNSVYERVYTGVASQEDYKLFASSVLHTLAKTQLRDNHREHLKGAFTYGLFRAAGENTDALHAAIQQFQTKREQSINITDQAYIEARVALEQLVLSVLAINPTDPRILSAPFSIAMEKMDGFDMEQQALTKEIMDRYLIHNRSVLTDTIFLGFPLHYFYTAVFLLVLFVGLCLGYCLMMERLEKEKKFI